MKPPIFFLFLSLLILNPLNAALKTADIEARIAIFFAQSKKFQRIYNIASPSYQLETTLKIRKNLKWWHNFSYIHQQGSSYPLEINTCLEVFSTSIGLKYLFNLSEKSKIYVGIGPLYSWLKEKNNSRFFRNVNKKNGGGVIFKSGITRVHRWLTLSFFLDYQVQKIDPGNRTKNRKINLNGLYFGVSAGGTF